MLSHLRSSNVKSEPQILKEFLLQYRGRIQGHYPLFIQIDSTLARKIIEETHIRTLHEGIYLKVAENFSKRKKKLTKNV